MNVPEPVGRKSARLLERPPRTFKAPSLGGRGGKRAGGGRPKGSKDSNGTRKKRGSSAKTTTHLNLQQHLGAEVAARYAERRQVLDAAAAAQRRQAAVRSILQLAEELKQHEPAAVAAALAELHPAAQAVLAKVADGARSAPSLPAAAAPPSPRQEHADPNMPGSTPAAAAVAAQAAVHAAAAIASAAAASSAGTAAAGPDPATAQTGRKRERFEACTPWGEVQSESQKKAKMQKVMALLGGDFEGFLLDMLGKESHHDTSLALVCGLKGTIDSLDGGLRGSWPWRRPWSCGRR